LTDSMNHYRSLPFRQERKEERLEKAPIARGDRADAAAKSGIAAPDAKPDEMAKQWRSAANLSAESQSSSRRRSVRGNWICREAGLVLVIRSCCRTPADEPVHDALKKLLLITGLWIEAAEVDRDKTREQMLEVIDRVIGLLIT
jgi:hypothetical protein